MIHIGFSQGKPIEIPLQHTIIVAITRYGKSTTLKRMKESIPQEFKVIFLDVKKPRDFEGMGVETPIYLEDRTDPVGLKNLLEASGKMGLKFEFSELIKVCKQLAAEDKEGCYGFRDVLNGINRNLKEKMHPIRESKLLVLQHLLGRLVKDLDKTPIVEKLEFHSRFNVMDLSKAPRMVKQLAVYSTIKWILDRDKQTIIVLDELPDFAPQRYGTPAREIISDAVRKGGASGIWLWLSAQTITGVDKNVLKECNYWILGRQREWNEAKRTLEQIPFKTGLKVEDVMTLDVGHFIVVSEDGAYLTYVQPPGLDAEIARKVSLKQLTVKDVPKFMVMEEDEMYKEKYEEEKWKREELEKEFTRQVERLSDLKSQEKVKQIVEELNKELENKDVKWSKQLSEAEETIKNLKEQLEAFIELKNALAKILGSAIETPLKEAIDLEHRELAINLSHTEQTIQMNTETVIGKVIYCALQDLPKEGFTETDLSKALQEHGWNIGHNTLAPTLGSLVKEGYLIKKETRPTSYRLPTKLKLSVAKTT